MRGRKFVEIVWLDACSSKEWCASEELPKPVRVTTRGWLVHECPDYIVPAGSFQHVDGDITVGEAIAIPQGCIIEIREISP